MNDPRVELFKAGMKQHGRGMPIQVFRGTSRYQYGAGVGDGTAINLAIHVPSGRARRHQLHQTWRRRIPPAWELERGAQGGN